MGTLFNQSPRGNFGFSTREIISHIEELKDISTKTGLPYNSIINTIRIMEMDRRSSMYRENGDAFDEQMAGFGELLEKIAIALQQFADSSSEQLER